MLLGAMAASAAGAGGDGELSDGEVLIKAVTDELDRSMSLKLKDLEKPYFIQYSIDDTITFSIMARLGTIVSSSKDRSRSVQCEVRVGSYELDNTNFSGGGFSISIGGGGTEASLPIDDDYSSIRQAVWWVTDSCYKEAVEDLTKKRAYMRDRNLKDRPNDFARAEPVEHLEPSAKLVFDRAAWEQTLKILSARFKEYPEVQDSEVRLMAGGGNQYVLNSEGTRVRTGETGILLTVSATVQAEDGMKLTENRTYHAMGAEEMKAPEAILKDIDALVDRLTRAAKAPMLESYIGPVLFSGVASPQMFRSLLAKGITARVDPVGTERRIPDPTGSLEKKLGQRILPRSFRVYDDPTQKKVGDESLFGHYRYDNEGVKAQRVDLVKKGRLEAMVMSRVPTKKLSGSNGHGRRGFEGSNCRAAIGCLFIEDEESIPDEELKERLIETAKEQGLDYGLKVTSIRSAGMGMSRSDILSFLMSMRRSRGGASLGDPVLVYKVHVKDGREELVRGIEFGPVKVRDLRDIVASGTKPEVYNFIGFGLGGSTPPSSIIAPAVLFEELELSKIEQEHEKRPLLKPPLAR
jgi:hypothetical protein